MRTTSLSPPRTPKLAKSRRCTAPTKRTGAQCRKFAVGEDDLCRLHGSEAEKWREQSDVCKQVFIGAFGPLPHPCAYDTCNDLVTEIAQYRGIIHHKDENPRNNDPTNLAIMHHQCHMKHHTRTWTRFAGRTHLESTKAKMSAAMSRNANGARCSCGMVSNPGSVSSHAQRLNHTWERL